MSLLIGFAAAAALGYWAYTDAKKLEHEGIRVGGMSPAAWGWGVMLLAIVFGILYLVLRPRAIAAARSPLAPGDWTPPTTPGMPAQESLPAPPRRRFCGRCGTELPDGAQFCPQCAHPVGESESPS